MRLEKTAGPIASGIFLVRSVLFILGCAAILWGATNIGLFGRISGLSSVADRIVAGERFGRGLPTNWLSSAASVDAAYYCDPRGLRSAAIIRLRMVENAITGNDGNVQGEF